MGAAASDYFTSYADVQYGFLDAELGILNFHVLAVKGDFHRVSICLKKGLDPNAPTFDDDDDYAREDTPMICAARGHLLHRGRKRHLKTLDVLLRFGGDVNKWNYLEQTPLYIACEKNLPRVAQWLVAHGADVNKSTKVGVSPLLCAYRNENVEMVKLLLAHGATALDPSRDFCRIKASGTTRQRFPTVAKELRGENADQRAYSDGSSESSSSDDDGSAKAARPFSSHLIFRPRWRAKAKAEPEPQDNNASPPVGSTPLPAVPASPPPSQPTAQELMRQQIQDHQQRQQLQRNAIVHDLDERQRIDEQREYREKLAVDNIKRKAKRKLKRDKAAYDKYIAHVEEKRQQHLAPLHVDRPTTSQSEHTRPHTTPSSSASDASSTAVALRWTKQLEKERCSVATAPSRLGRPTWAAQELWTTQVSQSAAATSNDGDERMLEQCQTVFNTIQGVRGQRERLREVYSAPAASMLPRAATRESLAAPQHDAPHALPPLGRDRLPRGAAAARGRSRARRPETVP